MYGLYISINKKILKGTLEGDKEHFRGPKITLKIKFFKKNYIPLPKIAGKSGNNN